MQIKAYYTCRRRMTTAPSGPATQANEDDARKGDTGGRRDTIVRIICWLLFLLAAPAT